MNIEKWWGLILNKGIKVHRMSESLKDLILESLSNRFLISLEMGDFELKEIQRVGLDAGGMVSINDDRMRFSVGGTTCLIFAHQVEFFLEILQNAKPRYEIGVEYYKIHDWLSCLCLTSKHREELIQGIQQEISKANALKEASNQEFNETLTEMNKSGLVLCMKRPVQEIGKE